MTTQRWPSQYHTNKSLEFALVLKTLSPRQASGRVPTPSWEKNRGALGRQPIAELPDRHGSGPRNGDLRQLKGELDRRGASENCPSVAGTITRPSESIGIL